MAEGILLRLPAVDCPNVNFKEVSQLEVGRSQLAQLASLLDELWPEAGRTTHCGATDLIHSHLLTKHEHEVLERDSDFGKRSHEIASTAVALATFRTAIAI